MSQLPKVLTSLTQTKYNIKSNLITMGAVIFLLAGCMAVLPESGKIKSTSSSGKQAALESGESVKSILYTQLRNWQGVQYQAGGLSRSGIDCSGFVYLTYRHHFDMELPRTTRDQSKSGQKISRKQLQPGDLVFFKTGWFDRHVGIYIENRQFVHASAKRGIMLSRLDDPYWSKKYWKSVRIPLSHHPSK